MQRPTENFRRAVADQLIEISRLAETGTVDAADEDRLDRVLTRILKAAEAAVTEPVGDQSPAEALAAVEAWAALASYVVASLYAPASQLRTGLAGWSTHVAQRLRAICEMLQSPLGAAARGLGADSCSVSVGFPWGVSVSLGWPVGAQPA